VAVADTEPAALAFIIKEPDVMALYIVGVLGGTMFILSNNTEAEERVALTRIMALFGVALFQAAAPVVKSRTRTPARDPWSCGSSTMAVAVIVVLPLNRIGTYWSWYRRALCVI
jgi:hypothetical protein